MQGLESILASFEECSNQNRGMLDAYPPAARTSSGRLQRSSSAVEEASIPRPRTHSEGLAGFWHAAGARNGPGGIWQRQRLSEGDENIEHN